MHYRIRTLCEKDNKAIECIIRACLIEFGANHAGTAWSDPKLGCFSEIYNSAGNQYWVAEYEDGTLAGGVGIGYINGAAGVCELQKMYCIPQARGTEIPHKLMQTALTYAARFYKQCYLETLPNMIAAQKFYEKYDFKRISEPIVKTEHFACDVRYIRSLENMNESENCLVREARDEELNDILALYLHLHETEIPKESALLKNTWETILHDKNHHLIVCEVNGKIVSSCVCVIIPNLTRNVRPYAFVENVVTNRAYRGNGYASNCLAFAKKLAETENCYKIMLLTGAKNEETLRFYQKAGYNSTDKTAFIQWLP